MPSIYNAIAYRTLDPIHRPYSFFYVSLLLLLLLVALLRLDQDLVLVKQLRQVSILVHGHQDVASANKLLVQVQLRDGGPVRVLLDSLAQLRVLQDVEGGELFGAYALDAEDLDDGAGEAALGRFGGSLHEEHDGRRGNGLVDGAASGIGQQSHLEWRERHCHAEGREGSSKCRPGCWPSSLPQEALSREQLSAIIACNVRFLFMLPSAFHLQKPLIVKTWLDVCYAR